MQGNDWGGIVTAATEIRCAREKIIADLRELLALTAHRSSTRPLLEVHFTYGWSELTEDGEVFDCEMRFEIDPVRSATWNSVSDDVECS